ncbi:MAG: FmdB family zinc ribbon protein, partial [Egicoccus sp.]
MPTYEYACRDCGEHLEVVQSFKDDALTECPSCHGSLRKVFSAAGLIFKGSGWHVKDYASSSKSPSSSSSEKSGSE